MWYRSYRDHVIMAFPSFDTSTRLWAPQASIAWVDGPIRKSEFVRFAKRLMSEGDAVAVALNASRAWIDKRLRNADERSPLEIGNEAHAVPGKSRLLESDEAKLPRTAKPPRSAPRILTYEQFKSLMEESGLGGSEQSLQKSYTALVQLRKQNHCSWAHIRLKVTNSRDDSVMVARPNAVKTRPPRLPLTLRDWRRVL